MELLEQGRSVLWTHALNLRTDLARLAEKAPQLAERLDEIRKILDTPMPDTADGSAPPVRRDRTQQEFADLRRRKAREWDAVLAQVRALEGFEHFLAATPYNELAAAATGGPVVIINASSHGCHALIVDPGSEQPRVITLARLRLDVAVERSSVMLGALAGAEDPGLDFRDRERARHAILGVLDWLWDDIAEPVLHALGHDEHPRNRCPLAAGVVVSHRGAQPPAGPRRRVPPPPADHNHRRRLRARPRDLLLHPHLDRTRSQPRTTRARPCQAPDHRHAGNPRHAAAAGSTG